MSTVSRTIAWTLALATLGLGFDGWRSSPAARQPAGSTVPVDSDDIGGIVTGAAGPESGVWVIAETKDLPTGYRRIVVTDGRGRYLVPDLPKATYDIWVRGYGLVDSPATRATPGGNLALTAVRAPDARAAAAYYPANYWYSLLEPPARHEFPGTGAAGNGIAENMKDQEQFLAGLTQNGCSGGCHQIGTRMTREMPNTTGLTSVEAWDRRIQVGQNGAMMSGRLSALGRRRALQIFADWTDRIARGKVPPAPPRPDGVERNIVVTEWDWGKAGTYAYDARSTNEANPRANANGAIYGAPENSADVLFVLDPVRHTASEVPVPILDPANPPPNAVPSNALPAHTWAADVLWNGRTSPHNPMIDSKDRTWINVTIRRSADQPAWCKAGSSHPSAKFFPLTSSNRQLAVYDRRTSMFTPIDTCFGTHNIDIDAKGTLWFEGGNGVVGWFSTTAWDETHDLQRAQGWIPFILDTNGNGKQDTYVEPAAAIDPAKDKRIVLAQGLEPDVAVSPADGSVWVLSASTPGMFIRISPGANPPLTSISEVYEMPYRPGVPGHGHTTRGIEIDGHGIVWLGLGSGHLGSFDRRKCRISGGPTATGQQCPEGWTFHPDPGPTFKGTDTGTDAHYHSWVDQFDTSGLGANIPFSMGTNSDSLLAFLPGTGKWVVFRVPYPMGFYPKGMDGRIDDPKAGWKGRGLWSAYSGQVMWHQETGKGSPPRVLKFQLRPNPLAK